MAKILMLWSATAGLRIGSAEASQLAALGVTSVALLRDDESVGVLLDGWSFDPVRSARAAAVVLGADPQNRILFPVLDIGVEANAIGVTDAPITASPFGDTGGPGAAGR